MFNNRVFLQSPKRQNLILKVPNSPTFRKASKLINSKNKHSFINKDSMFADYLVRKPSKRQKAFSVQENSVNSSISLSESNKSQEEKNLKDLKMFKVEEKPKFKKGNLKRANMVKRLFKINKMNKKIKSELLVLALEKKIPMLTQPQPEVKPAPTFSYSALEKDRRSEHDILYIVRLLETFPLFVKTIAVPGIEIKEVLYEIAKKLGLLKLPANSILFRQGDVGFQYYIVLEGELAILIAKEYKIKMSFTDYVNYLISLNKAGENFLLNKIIIANTEIFGLSMDDFKDMLKSRDSLKLANSKSLKMRAIDRNIFSARMSLRLKSLIKPIPKEVGSVEEYIQSLNPQTQESKEEKREVTFFTLIRVHTLLKGAAFGEQALQESNSRRSATILATKNCNLGVLELDDYNRCMKDINDKIRRINNNIIYMNQLFLPVSRKSSFTNKYYNFFVAKKFSLKQKIIKSGDPCKELVIIKGGEFELCLKASIVEMIGIIKAFGGRTEDLIEKQDYLMDFELNKFVQMKRVQRMKIIGKKEVLGLGDCILNGKWVFDLDLISNDGEVFTIEHKVLY